MLESANIGSRPCSPWLHLNHGLVQRCGLELEEAALAAGEADRKHSGAGGPYTAGQFVVASHDPVQSLFARDYYPCRVLSLVLVPRPRVSNTKLALHGEASRMGGNPHLTFEIGDTTQKGAGRLAIRGRFCPSAPRVRSH